jgi:hypothetical protein
MNTNPQAVAFLALVRLMAADCLGNLSGLQKLVNLWQQESLFTSIPDDANVIQDNNNLQPVTDAQVQTFISDAEAIIASYTANTNAVFNRMTMLASGKYPQPV